MNQVEWHSLVWPNVDARVIAAQRSVLEHFGIDIRHTHQQIDHGEWMGRVVEGANSDLVGFFDVDCVPCNSEIVGACERYAASHKSFIGLAQASNHLKHSEHIFAAPSFFLIWRQCWHDLGRPTFRAIKHIAVKFQAPGRLYLQRTSDVAENISYTAERAHLGYRALYPTHYEVDPPGRAWSLTNYGRFGIGTTYQGGFYHLFQSRLNANIELFQKRCGEIVAGKFTTDGMTPVCRLDDHELSGPSQGKLN